MSGEHGDGYRRGRRVEEEREPKVGSVYRRLLLIIWTLGTVIGLAVFGASVTSALAVVVVMHIFFAGIIWADIRSLRKQGVEWGLSRHLWFSSALVFPFVTLVYCWYVQRVVRRENERRGYGDGEPTAGDADGATADTATADAAESATSEKVTGDATTTVDAEEPRAESDEERDVDSRRGVTDG